MVLLIQKLNLSVWHNDPLGRNSFLGEIEVDLASWDWSNKKLNWYPLKPRVSVSLLQSCYPEAFRGGRILPDSPEVSEWCGGAEQAELYPGKRSKTLRSPGDVSAVFDALN